MGGFQGADADMWEILEGAEMEKKKFSHLLCSYAIHFHIAESVLQKDNSLHSGLCLNIISLKGYFHGHPIKPQLPPSFCPGFFL